jgi:hypothetical protein
MYPTTIVYDGTRARQIGSILIFWYLSEEDDYKFCFIAERDDASLPFPFLSSLLRLT